MKSEVGKRRGNKKMKQQTLKNNVLFLLQDQGKSLQDLKTALEIEEITLIATLEGHILYSSSLLWNIASFFGLRMEDLFKPMTEKNYSLFENEEAEQQYLQRLEKRKEEIRNQRVDFSDMKKVREWHPNPK